MNLKPEHYRNVADWPKAGIQFKDIGPVLRNPDLLAESTLQLVAAARELVDQVDFVVAPEARGFLFGPSLAIALKAGFVPARKPNKLPPTTASIAYELEYGEAQLHIHEHELDGARVLIHDDLLATGGTAAALVTLLTQVGAQPVAAVFLSEIPSLSGRSALGDLPCGSLVSFK
ncbi:MAG: adenine phosphoribosyltransferase [Actinobacteria bacterium]|uniref:adenine phosphoribosyltransferase n=1 Tax=freshwater metagenome TaxID=449393 RepID=A0A6J7ENZ5_9ZZZZ|nr:adenine phosphoribosyltransferase [Actinomycetota bacterium]